MAVPEGEHSKCGVRIVRASVAALLAAGFDIEPSEWWEVPDSSRLGRVLERCAPDFEPVTDERGELIDVVNLKALQARESWRRQREEEARRMAELRESARRRGYEDGRRRTPVSAGTLSFLREELEKRICKIE